MADKTRGKIANLLFFADRRSTNALTLDYAVRFAAQYDAHLTGLYIKSAPSPAMVYGDANSNRYLDVLESVNAAAAEAKIEFESSASRQGVRYTWIEKEGIAETIASHALRCADIGIVGQQSTGDDTNHTSWINALILSAGRPVIVVPNSGWNEAIGEKIVIGWDESQPATRAVHDAMPLLLRASETIDVLHIQDKGNRNNGAAPALCAHLARHGIKANAFNSLPSSVEPGHALLSLANVGKANLLVLGAWGHSRLMEFVVGGTTRTVLAEARLPVLMSH